MTKRQRKPPATQDEVIDKLGKGWQLGHDVTIDGRWWMQRGQLGHGGPTREVNASSASALVRRGKIRAFTAGSKFPTERWGLV